MSRVVVWCFLTALSKPLFDEKGIMTFGTEDPHVKDQYVVACKLGEQGDIIDYHRFHIPGDASAVSA